jgi:WD40 repeat protein
VSDDKTIRVWDLRTRESEVLRPPVGPGDEGRRYAATLSPDGKTLAVAGHGIRGNGFGEIYLIDLGNAEITRVLTGHPNATVFALAFAPNGRTLASSSSDGAVVLWDIPTEAKRVLRLHQHHVHALAFSPDGQRLATGSHDETALLWSVANGTALAKLQVSGGEINAVTWTPDDKTITLGAEDGSISFCNLDGTLRHRLADKRWAGGMITSLTFSPTADRLLFTFGANRNPCGAAIINTQNARQVTLLSGHKNPVTHAAFSRDGTLVATLDGDQPEVRIWKLDGMKETLVQRLAGEGKSIWSVAWNRQGDTVAWGERNKPPFELQRSFHLKELELNDIRSTPFERFTPAAGALSVSIADKPRVIPVSERGRKIAELKLPVEHDQALCAALLSEDRVAVGSNAGLYLFNARTGALLRTYIGHTGEVYDVAVSPSGKQLVSGSFDQTVRVWNVEQDESLLALFTPSNDWVVWTPEGYYASSLNGDRHMGWHANNGAKALGTFHSAAKFEKSLYRDDVVSKVLEMGSVAAALESLRPPAGAPALAPKPMTQNGTDELKEAELPPEAPPPEPPPALYTLQKLEEIVPPKVTLLAPAHGKTFASEQVRVEAEADAFGDNHVTQLLLLVNGRPFNDGVDAAKRIEAPRAGKVRTAWEIKLTPGAHEISVQAEGKFSQGDSEIVAVTIASPTASDPKKPVLYVLAIGVSTYRGDLRLNFAAADAIAIEQAFKARSAALFSRVETRLLTDDNATAAKIVDGLAWLKANMTGDDVGIVFFAGHGMQDSKTQFHLLGVDADPARPLVTTVSEEQLIQALHYTKGRLILMLDACHAGTVGGDRRRSVNTDKALKELMNDDHGLMLMCASMGREFSLETDALRHGVFTAALLEALVDGKADLMPRDGIVYTGELGPYVAERVRELTNGKQHPVYIPPALIRSFPLAQI